MAEMSIELSRKDMKQLFLHFFYGHWLLTATKTKTDPVLESFYQKMLSIMKNHNIENEIEYDVEDNNYYLTSKREEALLDKVEDYNEDTFYEELIERLTQRDVIEKYGEKITNEEYNKRFHEEDVKYYDEINKNGIQNIRIVRKESST